MKKLLYLLILSPVLLLSQSIYPLKFTFDDSNLYLVDMYFNQEENKLLSVQLNDIRDENWISIDLAFPGTCTDVKMGDLFNFNKLSKKQKQKCAHLELFAKNDSKIYKKISKNAYLIKRENENYTLFIAIPVDDNDFPLALISSHSVDEDFFSKIALSIKSNKNISDIKQHFKDGMDNIKYGKLNLATKNLASMMILDPDNEDVSKLYQEVYSYKRLGLLMFYNQKYIKEKTCEIEELHPTN